MVTILSEARYAGEYLLSEAGMRSRDQITIAESQTLEAGALLGAVVTAATVERVATAGNTGNGVMTLANPAFGPGAKPGTYRVTAIEPGANGGVFQVEDPDGNVIGTASVGVAYDGPVKFTIADGATDFVSGDSFTVTASQFTRQFKALAPAATDGSQICAAILFNAVTTGAGETQEAAAHTRDCEVNDLALPWGALTTAQKAKARSDLAARGIIVRQA